MFSQNVTSCEVFNYFGGQKMFINNCQCVSRTYGERAVSTLLSFCDVLFEEIAKHSQTFFVSQQCHHKKDVHALSLVWIAGWLAVGSKPNFIVHEDIFRCFFSAVFLSKFFWHKYPKNLFSDSVTCEGVRAYLWINFFVISVWVFK